MFNKKFPQLSLLILLIPAALAWCACSGKAAASGSGDSDSSGSDSVYRGKSSLTYNVEGRKVSIKDFLEKDGKNIIALFINKAEHDEASGNLAIVLTNSLTHEVFDFVIAGRGNTHIVHSGPGFGSAQVRATYMSPQYQNYYADDVNITLTASDASHVAADFSGKFLDENGKPIQITDGKFDVLIQPASKQ